MNMNIFTSLVGANKCLSQLGVWMSFEHPNPQKSYIRTPHFSCEEVLEMPILSKLIRNFHFYVNARILLKGTIQFLNKKLYPCGYKLKMLWSPLEYWKPKNFNQNPDLDNGANNGANNDCMNMRVIVVLFVVFQSCNRRDGDERLEDDGAESSAPDRGRLPRNGQPAESATGTTAQTRQKLMSSSSNSPPHHHHHHHRKKKLRKKIKKYFVYNWVKLE